MSDPDGSSSLAASYAGTSLTAVSVDFFGCAGSRVRALPSPLDGPASCNSMTEPGLVACPCKPRWRSTRRNEYPRLRLCPDGTDTDGGSVTLLLGAGEATLRGESEVSPGDREGLFMSTETDDVLGFPAGAGRPVSAGKRTWGGTPCVCEVLPGVSTPDDSEPVWLL